MADIEALLDDLAAEGQALDAIVSESGPEGWGASTPAQGWTVAVQVAHLHWTDVVAARAASRPDEFNEYLSNLLVKSSPEQLSSLVDDEAFTTAQVPRTDLLSRWRQGRNNLVDALRAVPAGQRVPWFGPSMSAASMATARIMETWAHGQDIADALGVYREPTERIRHVAHIGVRTRDFAFVNNNRASPEAEFRVVLRAPDGSQWAWGPEDAVQSVTGEALDFCLLVTQRRHLSDLGLVAIGSDAESWLGIAQAFAGPPGNGRGPLS